MSKSKLSILDFTDIRLASVLHLKTDNTTDPDNVTFSTTEGFLFSAARVMQIHVRILNSFLKNTHTGYKLPQGNCSGTILDCVEDCSHSPKQVFPLAWLLAMGSRCTQYCSHTEGM